LQACAANAVDAPDISSFPTTRYQGSKRKIVPWIWTHLRELDFDTALDVFGGTASVSYLLKKMGKEVTYNDHLRFNHLVGTALIENDEVRLDENDIARVVAPLKEPSPQFVRQQFKGFYYTDSENAWIDNTVARIQGFETNTSLVPYKKALLSYALFQSCLIKRPFNLFHRRNLQLRLSDVERSFGNKTTWEASFEERFVGFCNEANKAVFKGQKNCRATCYDVLDIPSNSYDLIYVDPPYLKRDGDNESSDYRRCYHFLEGLCHYNNWREMIDYDSPNFRLKQVSNAWTDRKLQRAAIDALVEKFRKSVIVLSYKKYGTPSIETLVRTLKRHGKAVRSHSRHYKYALNHQNGTAALNREVLLVAE
jgi:adenine-specific DNA methylase